LDGFEVRPDRRRIEVRSEGRQALLIEGDPGLEEARRPAQKDDADIEGFAAFDPRQDPDDRVLERVTRRFGHVPPPRRRTVAPRDAGSDSGRRLGAVPPRPQPPARPGAPPPGAPPRGA